MVNMRFMILPGLATLALAAAIHPVHATEYEFSWAHPQPQGNDLGGAVFYNDWVGYTVGPRGTTLKTEDGGLSWQLESDLGRFSTDLEDVLMTASGELIAVGASPGIFRSADEGRSWMPIPNPSTGPLHDIESINPTVLSVVGSNGQVLRSSDGGDTWTMLASPGGDMLEQLWLDPWNGYVMGANRVRRTTDGGLTWAPLPGITDSDRFNEAFFTDDQHGYIFSDSRLWKSVDGGATWSGQFLPGDVAYPANAVVLGPLHFLVVRNLGGETIFETTDGGDSWTISLDVGPGGFLDFDRLPGGRLVAVGTNGDVYLSSDDGRTWSNRTQAIAGRQQPIGALAIGPGGRGSAGTTGSPGQQWYLSYDGGSSWRLNYLGAAILYPSEIAYWNADRAIAAGDFGRMWRTPDGGQTWGYVPLPGVPVKGAAWHLSLPSPGVAFAAVTGQSESVVYVTTDYGATWQMRTTGIPAAGSLTGISFVNNNLGYVTGYTTGVGRWFKTTNGGVSWSAFTPSGLPGGSAWDLYFSDALTGVATFRNSPGGIFRTTDGGLNWTRVSTELASELSFFDAAHGIASLFSYTPAGAVLVTEDGGVSWQRVILPSPNAGSAVSATADGFWVAGTAGMIMKATRYTITSSVGESTPGARASAASAGPSLRSSPSVGARIEAVFALPERGGATLDVIDVSGRRVARLTSGEFDAGAPIHAWWDGRTDRGDRAASGVYFVRLASERGNQAIRVVLVR